MFPVAFVAACLAPSLAFAQSSADTGGGVGESQGGDTGEAADNTGCAIGEATPVHLGMILGLTALGRFRRRPND